jgi:hypothetical protein
LKKDARYTFQWFDTIHGEWKEWATMQSDRKGNLVLPNFPEGSTIATRDWAAKILEKH